MREIKFRGKKVSDSKWAYGHYTKKYLRDKHLILDIQTGIIEEVIPETLGQYIGLKDKSDKEIYEHDITRVRTLYGIAIGVVEFHKCSFCFKITVRNKYEDPCREIRDGWYSIEVVGNKFDNSELLKEN